MGSPYRRVAHPYTWCLTVSRLGNFALSLCLVVSLLLMSGFAVSGTCSCSSDDDSYEYLNAIGKWNIDCSGTFMAGEIEWSLHGGIHCVTSTSAITFSHLWRGPTECGSCVTGRGRLRIEQDCDCKTALSILVIGVRPCILHSSMLGYRYGSSIAD